VLALLLSIEQATLPSKNLWSAAVLPIRCFSRSHASIEVHGPELRIHRRAVANPELHEQEATSGQHADAESDAC
jgi:hypothetical protein